MKNVGSNEVEFGNQVWSKKGLVTSKNHCGVVFLMGCVEYAKEDGSGVSTVVFTPSYSFFFYDDSSDVLWSMSELQTTYTSGAFDGQFPIDYDDNYIPICNASADDGEDYVSEVNMVNLARFGLGVEAAQDILARMKDLKEFRVERDITSN